MVHDKDPKIQTHAWSYSPKREEKIEGQSPTNKQLNWTNEHLIAKVEKMSQIEANTEQIVHLLRQKTSHMKDLQIQLQKMDDEINGIKKELETHLDKQVHCLKILNTIRESLLDHLKGLTIKQNH